MRMLTRRTAHNRDAVVDAQCDTKTIEARPRLEVLAGTRTVICCICEPRHSGGARDDLLRCGSVATRAQPATDPLRHADSKYAVGATEKNELRVDRSNLASRFSGRGNRCIPALHRGRWLGGAFRPGHPHFIQASTGP